MRNKVFTYWEGEMPAYIQLCLNTLAKANGNRLVILTPDNLNQWLGGLHENWQKIPVIASRVGAIRAAVIYQHGGWWCDADTIAVKAHPPTPATFSYLQWRYGSVLNGYFGAPAKHPTTEHWLHAINVLLRDRFDHIQIWWRTLGEILLTPAVLSCGGRILPLETFLPVDFHKDPEVFLRNGVIGTTNQTITIGLNNSWLQEHAATELERPWNKDILIHKILRYGDMKKEQK